MRTQLPCIKRSRKKRGVQVATVTFHEMHVDVCLPGKQRLPASIRARVTVATDVSHSQWEDTESAGREAGEETSGENDEKSGWAEACSTSLSILGSCVDR